jgi:hypothetical protein
MTADTETRPAVDDRQHMKDPAENLATNFA